MRAVALELAARFMIDVVEGTYFGWDNTRYKSRRENNLVRAEAQWKVYSDSMN